MYSKSKLQTSLFGPAVYNYEELARNCSVIINKGRTGTNTQYRHEIVLPHRVPKHGSLQKNRIL